MNWKKEAVEDLQRHAQRRLALEMLDERIAVLDAKLEGTGRGWSMDTVGRTSRAAGDERLIELIAQRERLEESRRLTRRMVELVDKRLQALNEEQRTLMCRLYVEEGVGGVEAVARRMNVDRATVYRMRDEALRRYTLGMYGQLEM